MVLLLHLFLIYYLIIWKPCVSVVNVYYMGAEKRMRGKLIKLIEELVFDATAKITSVQQYKTQVYKSKQYQYGNLMYEINSRLAKMVQLYARVINFTTANPLNPILDKDLKYNEYNYVVFDAVEQIDNMAHEIDNFAAMIHLREANLHADKSKAPHIGKRKNGVWHEAVPK